MSQSFLNAVLLDLSSILQLLIQLLSVCWSKYKCEMSPLQMSIQYGSIPSSSFEWAVRDLPFCLSDSLYLLHEELMAVRIPFYTWVFLTPFSAPYPANSCSACWPFAPAVVSCVRKLHLPLGYKGNCKCFWTVHWTAGIHIMTTLKAAEREV